MHSKQNLFLSKQKPVNYCSTDSASVPLLPISQRPEGEPVAVEGQASDVVIDIRPEGEQKSEASEGKEEPDLDLSPDVIHRFMKIGPGDEFKGVTEKTRMDIMQAVKIGMNYLTDYPADQLGAALCKLFLENPQLRRQIQIRRGQDGQVAPDVFRIDLSVEEFDRSCCNFGGGMFENSAGSDPRCCILIVLAWIISFVSIRPIVKLCSSREDSTTKLLKTFLPLGIGGGAGAGAALGLGVGTGGAGFIAWAAWAVSMNIATAKECAPEVIEGLAAFNYNQRDEMETFVKKYLAKHPVNAEVFEALKGSGVSEALTKWKKPEDDSDALHYFARELLNAWVQRIAHQQEAQPSQYLSVHAARPSRG